MHRKLAQTPPMGWNSWDCYGCSVNEEQLRCNIDYMAKYLKKYGWEYIVCDIQWYEPKAKSNDYNNFASLEMDEFSRLIPAVNRFPSSANGVGFKAIADYCHQLGLKFGIHIMRGIPRQAVHNNSKILASDKTARDIASQFSLCPWNTDMYGVDYKKDGAQQYYNSIFNLYAQWGVDFVKCDDIANTEFSKENPYSAKKEIELIRKAINQCGRDMVLSLSPGPAVVEFHSHLAQNANMWRITGDFWDNWGKLYEMFERCHCWENYVQTGAYPDCDMLPLGKLVVNAPYQGEQGRFTKFTKDEQFTMMTLWSIFRSPLFMGGEMCENDDFTLSLLTNEDIIKMNKTSVNARELYRNEINNKGEIAWVSQGENCKYLAIFNTDDIAQNYNFDISKILMPSTEYTFFELWSKRSFKAKNNFTHTVNAHGVKVYKIFG